MIRFYVFILLFFYTFFYKVVVIESNAISALWLVKNVNKNVMRQSKRWNLWCTGEKKINPVVSLSKIIFFIANLPSFYVHFYYYNSRSFVDWIVGNQQKKKTKIWCRTNTVCIYKRKKRKKNYRRPWITTIKRSNSEQLNNFFYISYNTLLRYYI